MMSSKPFVEFNGVWLAYNDELLAKQQFAVEDINLEIQSGEFIAIVGPSGCGKSTFMKLTTGLRRPTRGLIKVDGEEVTGPLKISGMAFQAPSLLPWRTTLDNVLLPLEIVEPHRSQFKAKKAEYEHRAVELLKRVGLGGYERKYPWQLSGGMPSPEKNFGAPCATCGRSRSSMSFWSPMTCVNRYFWPTPFT